ncbi:MAG: cupin domain-containing protein [Kiritimatiellia bacterium]|jgi:mannose-6-phosphate isomerase-like protein (cupin superfamily)|nr:cupin domain-containing protein [Pseudomonadales bacterium]MDP6490355.1 cupin domain-containing protein [Kiritimatiellia bacterium]MDP6809507.1 cupin domain-containing protein [Kiritimatiellia bacterium]MDP7022677.1 cupin domain-containing protein [Kiritimatiellia bacterium]
MIRRAADRESEVREAMRGGDGSVEIKHFITREEWTANTRLCAELTLPPGASIGSHQHLKEDEVYIITAGSGLIDDGSGAERVSVGDAILTGNGETHTIRNDGDVPLTLIAVIVMYGE